MKKRIVAVLLALCLALALVPMSAFAAEGDFVISQNGVLTKYTGADTDVVIPEGVIEIGNNVFQDLPLTSVTFPSSLLKIGFGSFAGCRSLTNVTLPDGLVEIANSAFQNCVGLENVVMYDGVKRIGSSAFNGCLSLKSATIPTSVTKIGAYAYTGDISLSDVYYGGSQMQWNSITFETDWGNRGNKELFDATIHYNSPMPEPPAPTTPTDPDPEPSPKPDPEPSPKPDPEPSTDPDPEPDPDTDLDAAVKVTGVTVSKTGLTMEPGQSVTLTATVSPAAAENKSVTWTSNNPAAVSVDANGRVTALAAGSAEIVVRTADGGFTAICRIIVKGEDKPAPAEVHFSRMNVYNQGQFTDVPANQWYTDGVKQAFEFGLMKGTSAKKFDPQGSVTVAQAITMAARIHSIYTTGGENFVQGGVWYQVYLDYAFQNGIINYAYYNSDVTKKATRAQFAEIFAGALPEEALSPINDVDDGAIPDVSMSAAYAAAAYKLYRAGILTGSDVMGTFSPDSYITRQEAATIVTRMAESSSRKSFTLG